MNLRFVWQILRKDARRLWWIIGVTLALLFRLVHFDSWRSGATPGSEEGWLHILLPLAWSFLIALAILEDPVVGDAPFWVTVPCRWPSLLAAKAAFVAVFVHLPYFVACTAIVHARGFAPPEYLSVLFDKQVTLLALTLPAMALAAMVGNVTRFMIVAIVLAAIAGAPPIPAGATLGGDALGTSQLREVVLFSIVVVAAVCITLIQYWRRQTTAARSTGVVAILIAALIWWLPGTAFDGLQVAVSPAPAAVAGTSIQLGALSELQELQQGYGLPPRTPDAVRIPLSVTGITAGYRATFNLSNTRLQEPDGHTTNVPTGYDTYRSSGAISVGHLVTDFQDDRGHIPKVQWISFGKALLNRLRDEPVTVQGRVLVSYYRRSDPVWTSLSRNLTIAGLGKCGNSIVGYNPSQEMLRVVCESPGTLPMTRVRLFDPQGNREWVQSLDELRVLDYPANTWLSPVDRTETFFGFTDEEHYNPKMGATAIPREVVQTIRIAFTHESPEGKAVIGYDLPGIRLGEYLVKQ